MCGPVLGILGGVMQGIGGFMAAQQQAASYRAQAAIHERQEKLAREQGAYEAKRAQERGNQVLGEQVAAYSASGIQPGTGSAADVIHKTGQDIDLDVKAIRYGSKVAQENERTLATINRYNATATAATAPLAFLSPIIGSAGTFMKGAFG